MSKIYKKKHFNYATATHLKEKVRLEVRVCNFSVNLVGQFGEEPLEQVLLAMPHRNLLVLGGAAKDL